MYSLKVNGNNALIPLFIVLISGVLTGTAWAQYPGVPQEDAEKAKQVQQEARESVNAKWEAANELRDSLEINGKPFIPWASSPNDLPQADIPAFPGRSEEH